MSIIVTGKVWKFGDHINTDYMAPSFTAQASWEDRKKSILHIHKAFTEECQPGDVIVAGKNFGCGSSRENAPTNLKQLGIGCVVAESFGRIFFRNCIAVALPVMACQGISDIFDEGDQLELDFENSIVKNLTAGQEAKGLQLSPDLLNIVKKGGILALLKSESQLTT
ncbi:MAG: 3-isopropylmalate dehydratase [Desulfobacteraceae bacterium]|nr:3-isopropylmalate dehydratase [Desulfobacteraceae bacterium]